MAYVVQFTPIFADSVGQTTVVHKDSTFKSAVSWLMNHGAFQGRVSFQDITLSAVLSYTFTNGVRKDLQGVRGLVDIECR